MIYLVTATIQPIKQGSNVRYKMLVLEGLFIPKEGKARTQRAKIKQQCEAYLLKKLKEEPGEFEFEFKKLTITRFKNEFAVNEDKE